MIKQTVVTLSFMAMITGCGIEYRDDPRCAKSNYMTYEELRASVSVEESREIKDAGKIYVYGDTLLVNEKQKGVHIIDNSDKRNPINKAFVSVLGSSDIAVKDGYMMVDSFMDLVVIDIHDMNNIKEVNRTTDIFPKGYHPYSWNNICGFDLDKGVILGVDND